MHHEQSDPDLAMVIERCPNLPENIKEAIKVLVKAYIGAKESSCRK